MGPVRSLPRPKKTGTGLLPEANLAIAEAAARMRARATFLAPKGIPSPGARMSSEFVPEC